jgi:hypothetical protein
MIFSENKLISFIRLFQKLLDFPELLLKLQY